MGTVEDEKAAAKFLPYFQVHKDGRVERLQGTEIVPASIDPGTNVLSKDVVIDPDTGLSARIYLPPTANHSQKVPLLIYYHGGGFILGSAFYPVFHNYLNLLVSQANIAVVSVNYRLAPEYPIPTAYNDAWDATRWAVTQSRTDSWLKANVDFNRVFLGGESAGANIAHNMVIQVRDGDTKLPDNVNILGIALNHPYFWGEERIGSEAEASSILSTMLMTDSWVLASNTGTDDPRINPFVEEAPSLSGLGCSRVLLTVAEKDLLRDRGWLYYETLKNSGWQGEVEIMEIEGEDHCFHLDNTTSEKAIRMMKQFVSFLNE